MIKTYRALTVMTVLLSFGAASSSAASFSPAMSQLLAAVPGGADALNAIVVRDPAANLVARGEMSAALEYDTSRADALLNGLAAAAHATGKANASRLFLRLRNEGTPAEKLVFMNATRKPYSFPSRFTEAVAAGGSCYMTSHMVCTSRDECRTVYVWVCD